MEEQKFRIGEVVFEVSHPAQKLVITKADGKLYSCKLQDDMKRPAVVYAERDLKSEKE
tara:strand:+ start:4085 stop:4258 length:174 start_codon:yes stop_codon:yes gene_type:complete